MLCKQDYMASSTKTSVTFEVELKKYLVDDVKKIKLHGTNCPKKVIFIV
jgi:hypothetical protein